MDDMKLTLYVMKAKKRIRELYHQTGGACYLSFSGGKDSTVVLSLIKLCEEDGSIKPNSIPAVFCNTKIEMDATLEFVQWVKANYYQNVEIIDTPKSFSQVIQEFGKPMLSKLKSKELASLSRQKENGTVDQFHVFDRLIGRLYGNCRDSYHKIKIADKDLHILHPDFGIRISAECCHQMKKIPFEIYARKHQIEGFFTGERMAEGGARQMMVEKRIAEGKNICTRIKGDFIIKSPIIDWDDETLEAFIEKYSVPLSRAYTEYGCRRTGCYLCPFSQELKTDLHTLYIKEPKKYKAALYFLKDVYIAQGITLDFDPEYMDEFNRVFPKYDRMRFEMLKKYRPNSRMLKSYIKKGWKID